MNNDKSFVEPFAVQETYVDGFTDYSSVNGMIFCAGYRLQSGKDGEPLKVAVLRLIFPAAMLEEVIALARDARETPPTLPSALRVQHHH